MLVIRRLHLYAGLFLLPWVLLYGITGAMFNHRGLFPDVTIRSVDAAGPAAASMAGFPTAAELARQVVDTLQASSDDISVALASDHGAEFTNNLMFEVNNGGQKHIVHLDPVTHSSHVVTVPPNEEQPAAVLAGIKNIQLVPNPQELAQESASQALLASGVQSTQQPKPFGWTKLNFLAVVDEQPVRVTYVLKDGHVDITRHTGHDGMTIRQLLLRMHTSHGQPPHWNGRMLWSIVVDVMAIAMVCWALSGLLMWWQIKRTRRWGAGVILLSIITAGLLYFSVHEFYVTTKL